jgi:protein tyrosine phosphatase
LEGEDAHLISAGGKTYIASSNPDRPDHFWKRVLEQKSPLVVKLNGQDGTYYSKEVDSLKQFQVHKVQTVYCEKISENITLRKLVVTNKSHQIHPVTHIELTSWQNGSLPTKGEFLNLIFLVNKVMSGLPLTTPITVHCVGGHGRTGTFIASHAAMDQKGPNFPEMVTQIRKQRSPKMVETPEQYLFLHEIHTEIEFERLREDPLPDISAETKILSYPLANKIEILGRKYIALCNPLYDDLWKFWEMVYEQKSPVIVKLNQMLEATYWPLDEAVYSDSMGTCIKVVKKSEEPIEDFLIKRVFEVSKGDKSRTVTQFDFLRWRDGSIPDPIQFLKLMHVIGAHCINDECVGPITVHCEGGHGRTGTFLAIHSSFGQQKPDLMDLVRFMRSQRDKHMVETVEQFQFIKDLAT